MANFDKYFAHPKDSGTQNMFLEKYGLEKVQGGICLSLVTTWLHLYLDNNNNKDSPNIIWHRMQEATMIKQVANNQEGYHKMNIDVNEFLNLYKLESCVGDSKFYRENAVDTLNAFFVHSPLLLVLLEFGEKDPLHAIALIKHNNHIYLFDPNVGVINAPEGNYQDMLTQIYSFYENDKKLPISKMTVDGIKRV